MKDDRVKEIAYGIPIVGRATVARWEVEVAIRLALAERDAEIEQWVQDHNRLPAYADLLAFLKEGKA